ncbi:MAG: acyl-CoA synthetase [Acidimicrobiia bacterium]|nr:acyl-CoA synthetase [Acidimicrobiia bacterium]
MSSFSWADLFEIVADAVGEREALVVGDRHLSYAELDARANRLAHHLASLGVGAGDQLGLYLQNGVEYVESMLAAFKLRAVPVNVNYRYVEDELRYLFDDADLVGVVCEAQYVDRVDAVRADTPRLAWVLAAGDDYEAALAAQSPARDFGPRSGDDLYVIYTGGTTGMPKGVMWRQEDAFFACLRGGNPIGEPARTPEQLAVMVTSRPGLKQMACAPLMHGAAQWTVFMALFGGDTAVLVPGGFDPDAVLDTVAAEKVNVITIVGDAMARPLAESMARTPRDLSSLYIIGSGGAIFSAAVQEQIKAQLPHITILDSFGVSETGYQGSKPPGDDDAAPRFAVDDTTAVLDSDLRPVEPGSDTVGMLARTGHVPLGYHKDPDKTAKTFVTDETGRRWALPGDMATVGADGVITLLGRGSQCINTGGEKVYPEEVESVLKGHPDVFDAVVVGVPDDRFGQRVAAVVAPAGGRHPTLDDVATHCRGALAGYKVPRDLVVVDEVQRSPSGKPDYRWARETAEGAIS